jgi:D-tyrosyl-tRNA(Tyr) deacylase
VVINGQLKSEISKGLLVFLGIEDNDTQDDVEWLAAKIGSLRIFDDNQGVMNLSVMDIDGEILSVSQFTLHAKTRKGNRPSYIKAAKPETAIPLYESFNKFLGNIVGDEIKTGEFGANMQVSLINDGPVTIIIDTKNKE